MAIDKICPYKLKNSDDWDKYNMTGFLIFTGNEDLKEDINSSEYASYEVNNVSGYISKNNMSFITQIDNGYYMEYRVNHMEDLDIIVKDYWN